MELKNLPKEMVEKGTALAKGATFFGVSVEEMDRESLLASFGFMSHMWKIEKDEAQRQRDKRMQDLYNR